MQLLKGFVESFWVARCEADVDQTVGDKLIVGEVNAFLSDEVFAETDLPRGVEVAVFCSHILQIARSVDDLEAYRLLGWHGTHVQQQVVGQAELVTIARCAGIHIVNGGHDLVETIGLQEIVENHNTADNDIYSLELCHLEGVDAALITCGAEFATTSVHCLLMIIGGQQSKDHRNVLCGIESGDAKGDALADIVKVRRVATDDAAQDDDGVETIVLAQLLCAIDELEAAGHSLDMDVLGQRTVLLKGRHATVEQCACDVLVPFSDNDTEAHVAGIGYAGRIVIG